METIKEAKDFLKGNWEKGVDCPCCKQFVKLYKRKFNSVMARTLIRLYKLSMQEGVEYHHVKEIVKGISDTGTNDFSKLIYWDLIQEKDDKDTKTRTSGYWKITEKGIGFINNQFSLPKYVFIYNTKKYGFSKDTTALPECLGEKFDYNELMQL